MNDSGGGGGVDGGGEWWAPWWWAAASTGQLAWAIAAYRRGYAGDSRMMPIKAFGVASLFVGAGSAATIGTLKSFGIHQSRSLSPKKILAVPSHPNSVTIACTYSSSSDTSGINKSRSPFASLFRSLFCSFFKRIAGATAVFQK